MANHSQLQLTLGEMAILSESSAIDVAKDTNDIASGATSISSIPACAASTATKAAASVSPNHTELPRLLSRGI